MKQYEVISPSRLKFTLRETTGDDDDQWGGKDNEADQINRYIANIVVKMPDGEKATPEKIKKLRLRDKYYLLIRSRVENLGPEISFRWDWSNGNGPEEYTADLSLFLWDYSSDDFPGPGHPEYYDQRLAPYPEESVMTKVLSTGRKVKLDFLDGVGEAWLMGLPIEKRTASKQVIARNFVYEDESGNWVTVKDFHLFSSREMAEIRDIYQRHDPPLEGLVRISSPGGLVESIPLLSIPDFFFPVLP